MEKRNENKIDINNKFFIIVLVIALVISISSNFGSKKKNSENNNLSNLNETSVIPKSTVNKNIDSINNATVTKPTSNLAYQEKCANDAHKSFINGGYDSKSVTYQNHLNQNLNTCFIVVDNTTDSGIYLMLGDANTNEEYGEYGYVFSNNSAFLIDCTQGSKPKSNCKIINSNATINDWQIFIKPYMEN